MNRGCIKPGAIQIDQAAAEAAELLEVLKDVLDREAMLATAEGT
jgi:hypothetical protein